MGVTLKYFPSFLKNAVLLSLVLFVALLTGCGPASMTINPNYNNPALHKDTLNANSKVVKVIDNRKFKTKDIGFAQVGIANNNVPYFVDGSMEKFIENSINKMIGKNGSDSSFVPLTVVVDSFKVYEDMAPFAERGRFDCNLRFLYPYMTDSVMTIATKSNQEFLSTVDVTNSLEGLVYKGVAECTDQFAKAYNEGQAKYFVSSEKAAEFKIDSTVIANSIVKEEKKDSVDGYSVLGFNYSSGDKIRTGIHIAYQTYIAGKKDRQFLSGFGYMFSFYDILNKDAMLEGSFVGFNYRYALRYYTSESRTGLYFGGAIKLAFGSESIQYGDKKETHFFIGPTFDEIVGISISEKVFIEAGAFQVKHFGSDLLPSDIGVNAGISFRL